MNNKYFIQFKYSYLVGLIVLILIGFFLLFGVYVQEIDVKEKDFE